MKDKVVDISRSQLVSNLSDINEQLVYNIYGWTAEKLCDVIDKTLRTLREELVTGETVSKGIEWSDIELGVYSLIKSSLFRGE